MDKYLYHLGSKVVEIRKLLHFTQEDFSKLIGISRPTLINIEREPSRLTKTIGLAFVSSLFYEIRRRQEESYNVNYVDWDDEKSRNILINQFIKTGVLNVSLLQQAINSINIEFSLIKDFLSFVVNPTQVSNTHALDKETFLLLTKKSLDLTVTTIQQQLDIEKFDLHLSLEKIMKETN